ncbi:MAG: cytochrome c-type biogenesis protein CcmH [Candidatus Tokpelaia sp. JSC085]|nr:MAG: cytochrome c-type biogenesis protein CcmH [Candidatus Tokpelaia sp. JSC085]
MRARAIALQLRCLVCRNETISSSQAALARDLRLLIRELLCSGNSDKQIIDFIVERYGEYILLQPPFEGPALILWFFPLFVLISSIVYLILAVKVRKSDTLPLLTQKETERIKILMQDCNSR